MTADDKIKRLLVVLELHPVGCAMARLAVQDHGDRAFRWISIASGEVKQNVAELSRSILLATLQELCVEYGIAMPEGTAPVVFNPPDPRKLVATPDEPPRVTGRGMRAGVCSTSCNVSGATIRIDDNERPEFWVEVRLSLPHLRIMIAGCEQLRELTEGGEEC